MATSLKSGLPVVFLFILSLFGMVKASEGPTSNPSKIDTSFEPGYLFAKLLEQLTKLETQLHRCAIQTNTTQCFPKNTSHDERQSHFTFSSFSKSMKTLCQEDESIFDCLNSDVKAKVLLKTVKEDISNSVSEVCCILQQCQGAKSSGRSARALDSSAGNASLNQESSLYTTCHTCASVSLNKGDEAVAQHKQQMEVLKTTTCTEKVVEHIRCVELNIIAFNILSGPTDDKLTKDAVNILQNCYPLLIKDPESIFTVMVGNIPDDEMESLKAMFAEDTGDPVGTDKVPVNTAMTPRAIAGFTVLFILIAICLAFTAFVIFQKVRQQMRSPHSAPHIAYSPISYHDEYLDDDGREDDEDMIGAL